MELKSRPTLLSPEMRENILRRWEARVRSEMPAASRLSTPVLVDTLPLFMNQLAEAIDPDNQRTLATDGSNVAEEHGGERARLSPLDPSHVVFEYAILRQELEAEFTARGSYSGETRKTVERSIDAATREAMTAYFLVHNSLREQFVAALSHDIRSPLSVIKIAAEMLTSATDSVLISRIIKNADKIDRLTKNLLDHAAIQLGERLSLKIGPTEAITIIQSVVQDVSETTNAKIKIDGPNVHGFWDANLLHRAIENLILNGIKYGETGKPLLVKVSTFGERAMIAVHNEGRPIPLEDRGLLFQSFQRTQSARASGKKGWGVGLFFVRAVAESHGGSVGVDSSPEGGTKFTIDIPCDARPFVNARVTHN